jgi:hypothetical protein
MALHWLALRLSPDCGYPKWLAFFMLPQNFFIFILFYDFYRKTYNKSEVTAIEVKSDKNNNNGDDGKSAKVKDNVKWEKSKALNYEKTFSD